ncbi:uncharacterized protein C14orf119 homolog [Brienomyrus brachyistius]|uniref:uncharacterized protein C14orf119 homolog n=1 Tax=Brienomyrus brachyistius TaxID=42636 RepID=UPI0020B17BD5|nr:uncharacterized protein C14orf119 homolog [Brienomyrus brachyistius]
MSWFSQVLQSSSVQPPPLGVSPTRTGPSAAARGTAPTAGQAWPFSQPPTASLSLSEFPTPPYSTVPPSLGELSSTSLELGPRGDPVPLSYVTLQEQRCVLSWFQGWMPAQKERFLQDLLAKAVPGKVCTLLEQLNTLQVRDRPPSIFECQLRLWSQWFESWAEEERNTFLHSLEEQDAAFVGLFYRAVAGTAGRE